MCVKHDKWLIIAAVAIILAIATTSIVGVLAWPGGTDGFGIGAGVGKPSVTSLINFHSIY
jgi:hypothetical protein